MMRFYTQPHRFYGGVDLHARTLAVCVLDAQGHIVRACSIPANPEALLDTVAPFRNGCNPHPSDTRPTTSGPNSKSAF
jgi:hypothetical protein